MTEPSPLAVLRDEKKKLTRELEALDQAISALESVSSVPERRQNLVQIRGNEFQGMRLAAAVAKYLSLTPHHSAHLDEILPALLAGGANLGKEEDRYARTLRIAVRMNSKLSHHPLVYNDETRTVSLRHTKKEKESRTA